MTNNAGIMSKYKNSCPLQSSLLSSLSSNLMTKHEAPPCHMLKKCFNYTLRECKFLQFHFCVYLWSQEKRYISKKKKLLSLIHSTQKCWNAPTLSTATEGLVCPPQAVGRTAPARSCGLSPIVWPGCHHDVIANESGRGDDLITCLLSCQGRTFRGRRCKSL